MSDKRAIVEQMCVAACFAACLMSLVGCGSVSIPRPSGTGTGTILTWTSGTSPAISASGMTDEFNNVTFGGSVGGNGLFVAVGSAGAIVTSPDGVHWTLQTSPTSLDLYGVTYGNNQFIAVGGNDVAAAGVVLTGTPDGVTWTMEPTVTGSLAVPLTGVTYANGQFVAVGDNQILSSPSGADTSWNAWPTEPFGITGPTVDLYNTAYGNNLFVTVGTYNESTSSQEILYEGLIATSTDPMDMNVNWSILPYTPNYLSGVTYGGGQFVAVGREGSILTSSDGTTWTPQSAHQLNVSQTPYLISVLYAGDQYVATGNYVGVNPSTGFLLTSADGKAWTMQPTPTGANVYGIGYGEVAGVGTYVAVGGE